MKIISIVFLIISTTATAVADPDYQSLAKYFSPTIKGDTLYITGRIDSHIYDYLTYEAKKVQAVKYISLNSYGGNHNWGLEVSAKIQLLGKTTVLESGNVCASACVYLFASGKERIMSKDTWLGVHGARLGGGYATNFAGYCFVELEDGEQFVENKKGCKDFLASWYGIVSKATNDAFDLMEKAGVSPDARTYYFSKEDDPKWYESINVFKKPDWVISPDEALKYQFATALQ